MTPKRAAGVAAQDNGRWVLQFAGQGQGVADKTAADTLTLIGGQHRHRGQRQGEGAFAVLFNGDLAEHEIADNLIVAQGDKGELGNIFRGLAQTPNQKVFGAVGVAIGTAIPVFIGNGLIMNWYYNKYIGLDIPRFWRRITALLPSLVVPAIAAILIACLAHASGYFGILFWGVIYVVIFIVSVWLIGLTPREKEIVTSPLKRIIYKILSKLLRL